MLFEIQEINGRSIHLSEERWRHISSEHPNVALEEIKMALEIPTKTVASKYNPQNIMYYYRFHKLKKTISFGCSKIFKRTWLYYYCVLCEDNTMKKKLYIHYDPEGDFLEVRFGKVTPSYYEDLGNDVFERHDEKTKKNRAYAFFNVQKRKEVQDIEVLIPEL